MSSESTGIIYRKSAFVWLATVTAVILLIPLVAMQFTDEVNWTAADFFVMSFLIFSIGSLFILVARRTDRKYRVVIALLLATVLLYIWAELAVGIFTGLGS